MQFLIQLALRNLVLGYGDDDDDDDGDDVDAGDGAVSDG